jgi:hypothetical protein
MLGIEYDTILYIAFFKVRICYYMILVNDKLDTHSFFLYVYFNSLHVSSNLVLIIRRINCINTTSGMCHSDCLVCRSGSSFPTCILEGHLHRLTHTRCIDTIDSPDNEHSLTTCILDGHLHRLTHTRCCIDTIDSPDDEHSLPTCIINGHLHRVTHDRCCIYTIDSPGDEHSLLYYCHRVATQLQLTNIKR